MKNRPAFSLFVRNLRGLTGVTLFLFSFSCTYDKAMEVSPVLPESGDSAEAPEEMIVNYKQDILPIIEANCYSCHSATATHPEKPGYAFLDSYEGLKKYALKTSVSNPALTTLQARIRFVEYPGMPFKEDPLPEEEIEKIEAWIKLGAPDN